MDAPPPDDRDAELVPGAGLPRGTGAFARFLRAGGCVDYASWVRSSQSDQDALEAAGEVVARERARMLAEEIVALAQPDPLSEAARAALGGGA